MQEFQICSDLAVYSWFASKPSPFTFAWPTPRLCCGCRAPVAVNICKPQCITYLRGCLWVQFRMSTAPVYGCHISILLCTVYNYVCKIIAFVNFQDEKDIYWFIITGHPKPRLYSTTIQISKPYSIFYIYSTTIQISKLRLESTTIIG